MLDAYADRNADLALAVWHRDEQIDAMYNSVFRELLTYMMEDPRNIGMCTHLLFGAKNLERIGDHTTNIAETIHFFVLGRDIEADRPKQDKTSTTLDRPDRVRRRRHGDRHRGARHLSAVRSWRKQR